MALTTSAPLQRHEGDGRFTGVTRALLFRVEARAGTAIILAAVTLYAMQRIEEAAGLAAVPFSLLIVLALLTTALCGVNLGITATILASAGTAYFVFPDYGSFRTADESQWVQLMTSAVVAVIAAALYDAGRRRSAASRQHAIQLEEAARAKDDFIGEVSHELQTPVTLIIGDASILLREYDQLDKAAREESLTDIVESGERLQHRIENLLAVARAEAHVADPDEPVIVRHIVSRTIDRHRHREPGRQINLLTSQESTTVICPRESVEQVVDNLLTNAEKYSAEGTPIDVRIQIEPDELVIGVADRGPGFGNVNPSELFEPFARSDSARLAAPGLGLGLSVARRLVQAHGGSIWAQNRAEGGAEVTFSLPARVVECDSVPTAGPTNEVELSARNGHAAH